MGIFHGLDNHQYDSGSVRQRLQNVGLNREHYDKLGKVPIFNGLILRMI